MALPKAPKKTATEKRRVKMRGNRRSIEDIHMGPEPTYFGVEIPEDEYWTKWTKAANWYNYFYGPKDWKDDILKYTVEVLGYTEQEAKTLNKLADWKLNHGVATICKLHYRGMEQPEKYKEKVKTNIGIVNCMVFQPKMQEGRVFQDGEQMKIWISDDKNRLLIKVETEVWAGNIKAVLAEYQEVKYPLSISKEF